jgi:hypothetical protein
MKMGFVCVAATSSRQSFSNILLEKTMLLSDSVTITDIQAAQKRLLGIGHQTPVITSNPHSALHFVVQAQV